MAKSTLAELIASHDVMLADGGMGRVFLAKDLRLDRQVVGKKSVLRN